MVPYEFVQAGGYLRPVFTSVLFWETVFWRLDVPHIYGIDVRVDCKQCLPTMDSSTFARLLSSRDRDVAVAHFADCLDYGMGIDDMSMIVAAGAARTSPSHCDGTDFFESAKKDLHSAIADLMQYEPNSNSMQHSYAAIEKFMKAYLCYKFNYLAATLSHRPFAHSLEALVAEVQKCDPSTPLGTIDAAVISPYRERYEGTSYSRYQLWEACRRAHFAASCVARAMTPRDTRTLMGIPLTFF